MGTGSDEARERRPKAAATSMWGARGRVGEAYPPPRADEFAGFVPRRDRNQRAGPRWDPRDVEPYGTPMLPDEGGYEALTPSR
jgi:hypothetical protein